MKKTLLSLSLIFIAAFAANAQCTPGLNYGDSIYGAWPDTIVNFPSAMQNDWYSTDLNFAVPVDAGLIDPLYSGVPIQSFIVNSVIGLPPGLNYSCNISNCTYVGGTNGCAQISGICTVPGIYNIQINLTATILFMGQSVQKPESFTGYKIEVGTAGTITLLQKDITFAPNPASTEVSMSGLISAGIELISIYSYNGQLVRSVETNLYDSVDVNVTDLNEGVYLVHLEGINGTLVKKFIKN